MVFGNCRKEMWSPYSSPSRNLNPNLKPHPKPGLLIDDHSFRRRRNVGAYILEGSGTRALLKATCLALEHVICGQQSGIPGTSIPGYRKKAKLTNRQLEALQSSVYDRTCHVHNHVLWWLWRWSRGGRGGHVVVVTWWWWWWSRGVVVVVLRSHQRHR